MATASKESGNKICDTCTPKKTIAITSCHGCNRDFCRQHFNTHRDQLSKCLQDHIHLHNEIAQDLRARIDFSLHHQLNNDKARELLRQIDQWEKRTIDECRQIAAEARNSVKELFDKTKENEYIIIRMIDELVLSISILHHNKVVKQLDAINQANLINVSEYE